MVGGPADRGIRAGLIQCRLDGAVDVGKREEAITGTGNPADDRSGVTSMQQGVPGGGAQLASVEPDGRISDEPVRPRGECQGGALERLSIAKAFDAGQAGSQRGGQLRLQVGEHRVAVDIEQGQPVRRQLGEGCLVVRRIRKTRRSTLVGVDDLPDQRLRAPDDDDVVDDRIRPGLERAGGRRGRCGRTDGDRGAAVGRVPPVVFLALGSGAELGQSGGGLRIVPRDGEERHRRIGIPLWNPDGHRNLGAQPRLNVAGEGNAAIFQRFVELVRQLLVGAGIGKVVHRAEQVHLLRDGRVEVGHRVHVDRGGHHLLDRRPRSEDEYEGGGRGRANHHEPAGRNEKAPVTG